jgi:signal peptidase II
VKGKQLAALIILILIIDQAIKFYIKTNYYIGEEHKLLGMNWARLHFVENEGMAWGWKFGGGFGKIALTLFRLIAVIVGTFYLRDIVKKNYNRGFLICAALIYAGAAGNLIDSMFYGLLFEGSNPYLQNVAHFLPAGGGYAGFLHGRVVDMFYFPIITGTTWPAWVPVWGGQDFEFFRPVFNLADASISLGVITILIFQKRFFRQHNHIKTHQTIETNSTLDDKAHIS